jgi:hypothetical protein
MEGYHSKDLLTARILRDGRDNTGSFPQRMRLLFLTHCLDETHLSLFEDYTTATYASDTSFRLLDPHSSAPSSPSHEAIPFPSLRAPSALPSDASHHCLDPAPATSAPPDDYSWEWGGFPQRSQVHMPYPTHPRRQSKTNNSAEADEQLPANQPEESARSKSLPPEFQPNLPEAALSPTLHASEQLPQHEPLSDVETGYDRGLRTSGRERRSWVRWWRRDSRHPRSVDVGMERPSLRSAASTPLPTVSCGLCCGGFSIQYMDVIRKHREPYPFMFQLRMSARVRGLTSHHPHIFQTSHPVGHHCLVRGGQKCNTRRHSGSRLSSW